MIELLKTFKPYSHAFTQAVMCTGTPRKSQQNYFLDTNLNFTPNIILPRSDWDQFHSSWKRLCRLSFAQKLFIWNATFVNALIKGVPFTQVQT